jgi:hypothetical protein
MQSAEARLRKEYEEKMRAEKQGRADEARLRAQVRVRLRALGEFTDGR